MEKRWCFGNGQLSKQPYLALYQSTKTLAKDALNIYIFSEVNKIGNDKSIIIRKEEEPDSSPESVVYAQIQLGCGYK